MLTKQLMVVAFVTISGASCVFLAAFKRAGDRPSFSLKTAPVVHSCVKHTESGCVFLTLAGFETFDTAGMVINTTLIDAALQRGVAWLLTAQQDDGGWGAGSHTRQNIKDPSAVPSDPATTALSAMALIRSHEHPLQSEAGASIKNALNYLLESVETSPLQDANITRLTGTQPQSKLGSNIDVILTSQLLTNILPHIKQNPQLKKRVEQALNKCVNKIQRGQDADGSFKDGGWAPVLQSALANNALESAKDAGMDVNESTLERSREYQKKNYDVKTNSAVTGKAAGVMLYSLSSTARASAKEAKQAVDKIEKAKKDGKLPERAAVNEENLVIAGYTKAEAQKFATAYKVKKAATARAQNDDVMEGFGSNGGEEFLSYLMTGESLVMDGGNEWEKWFTKMSGRLLQIQNNNGSWSGHHCITSPVFCTATCVLILSVNKDMEFRMQN